MSDFFSPDDFFDEFKDLKALAVFAANKANRLLRERAQVVYSRVGEDAYYATKQQVRREATHTALLIAVTPIARDSAEKIVEDLIEMHSSVIAKTAVIPTSLIDRARALRGGE